MDKITKYQAIVLQVLEEIKARFKKSSYDIRPQIIADEKNHHYQFLWMGWKGDRQIFNTSIHIDILGGKVWIQKDNTEDGLANLLVERGIPKSDIVLAYFSPEHRKLTEFALG